MKRLSVFAAFFMLVSLASVSVFGQAVYPEFPLTVTDGAGTFTLYFGMYPGATFCVNPTENMNGHFESFLPPAPPTGVFDTRFVNPRGGPVGPCFDQGTPNDYSDLTAACTQRDTFVVRQQLGTGALMHVSWPNLSPLICTGGSATLRYFDGSANVDINMLTSNSVDLVGINDGGTFRIITVGPAVVTAGPCFSLSAWPSGVSANVGGFVDVTVTAANSGATNPLNVTGVSSDNADFAVVSPATPFVIPPSGSVPVVVRFSPAASGPSSGNITFTHSPLDPACGSGTTTVYAVNGTGISNALLFASDSRTHVENTVTYRDTLRLVYQGPGPLKALQLRLVLRGDDTTGLGLQGVTRGADLPTGTFNFATQNHYGPANWDGTANDTVSIVFYGNGSNVIPAGSTLNDLIRFRYGVGHLTPTGARTVHVDLLDVQASHPNGDPVSVSADDPQNVTITPQGVGGYRWGDVNHDGSVDILDLLLIVDYILGRNPSPFDFTLANIAPWVPGNPAPSPDGVVNVQDLALLQQIILTGVYPDGTPSYRPVHLPILPGGRNNPSGITTVHDVKLTLYVTTSGIAVRMQNNIRVKGLQFEFGNVPQVPSNMYATTLLGEAHYLGVDNLLRVLMYNMEARLLEPGDYLVGHMPFSILNPDDVTLNRYVVAGEQNNRVNDVEIEISHTQAPGLPTEYMLSQNYPNPFNPTTNIRFSVPSTTSEVKIVIFGLLGQEVRTLFSGPMDQGTRVVVWDGRDSKGSEVSSGLYVYRMTAGTFVQLRKMILMK